jgi:hypothetical protein
LFESVSSYEFSVSATWSRVTCTDTVITLPNSIPFFVAGV